MSYTIAVVTRIPEPDDHGNMAVPDCLPLYKEQRTPSGAQDFNAPLVEDFQMGGALLLGGYRSPVFRLGEILILDASGREPHGRGRKPSKWDITITHADTIADAVMLSRDVTAED